MPATPFILFLLSVTGEHRDNVFQKRSTTKKMALVCKPVTCLRTSLATAAKRILNFATSSNKQSITFWKKFKFQRMTIRRHTDYFFLQITDNLRIDFCEWKYSISTFVQSSKSTSFEVSKDFFLNAISKLVVHCEWQRHRDVCEILLYGSCWTNIESQFSRSCLKR